jgi:hypothetical protein
MFFSELLLVTLIGLVSTRGFEQQARAGWMWETWRFVKHIFQLLIVSIFATMAGSIFGWV